MQVDDVRPLYVYRSQNVSSGGSLIKMSKQHLVPPVSNLLRRYLTGRCRVRCDDSVFCFVFIMKVGTVSLRQ